MLKNDLAPAVIRVLNTQKVNVLRHVLVTHVQLYDIKSVEQKTAQTHCLHPLFTVSGTQIHYMYFPVQLFALFLFGLLDKCKHSVYI